MGNASKALKAMPKQNPRGQINADEELDACLDALGGFLDSFTAEDLEDPWMAEQVAIISGTLELTTNLYRQYAELVQNINRYANNASGLVVPN